MTAFKDAGLEYVTLQAENFLENHLLENLDEEVIEELDTVVRDNQLAHSPFARSGRAELLLHEQYPQLAQDIDEERQRRVRDMAFKINQKEEERKLSSSTKGRVGSLEDFTVIALSQLNKMKPGRNEPFSPDLRPKGTQADLMFSMDEDEEPLDSPSVRAQKSFDSRKQSDLDQLPSLAGSFQDKKQKAVIQTPLASPPIHEHASPDALGIGGSLAASTTPKKAGNPWASSAFPTAKLDLRDIMNEASPATSALSAGLAAQKVVEASAAKSQQPTKISQKERKRQQQIQAEQAIKASPAAPAKKAWKRSADESKSSSPWKLVSRDRTPSLPMAKATESAISQPVAPITRETVPAVPPVTKPLVAAETSTKSISRRTQSPDTRHSGQSRNLKNNSTTPLVRPPPKPLTSTFSSDMSSKPVVPHSKSYIRPASKSESTLGLSMADIINQEERNRNMVKEAVAKRSLMEIQKEEEDLQTAQAFQSWWEEESRRTQEAEAQRLAREREREREKAGRGGRRGRGDGKGKGKGSAVASGNIGAVGGSATGGPASGAVSASNSNASAAQGNKGKPQQTGQELGRGRGGPSRRGKGRGGPAKVFST